MLQKPLKALSMPNSIYIWPQSAFRFGLKALFETRNWFAFNWYWIVNKIAKKISENAFYLNIRTGALHKWLLIMEMVKKGTDNSQEAFKAPIINLRLKVSFPFFRRTVRCTNFPSRYLPGTRSAIIFNNDQKLNKRRSSTSSHNLVNHKIPMKKITAEIFSSL